MLIKKLFPILIIILLFACTPPKDFNTIVVQNKVELVKAIADMVPGDEIVLTNGIWKDFQIAFYGMGTELQPIVLRTEEPGKVFVEGESFMHLGGEHLVVDGLYFWNGYSQRNSIVAFQIGEDSTAFNCQIFNCVIEDFTKPNCITNDHWIEFYGQHNMLDHCYISGKLNDGETLRVFQTDNLPGYSVRADKGRRTAEIGNALLNEIKPINH